MFIGPEIDDPSSVYVPLSCMYLKKLHFQTKDGLVKSQTGVLAWQREGSGILFLTDKFR